MTSKPRHQAPSRRRRRDCFWRKIREAAGVRRSINMATCHKGGFPARFQNPVNVYICPAGEVP